MGQLGFQLVVQLKVNLRGSVDDYVGGSVGRLDPVKAIFENVYSRAVIVRSWGITVRLFANRNFFRSIKISEISDEVGLMML